MKGYYSQLCEILRNNDVEFHRQGKGSHEVWKHKKTGKTQVVSKPMPSRDLANTILKKFGISIFIK